jgi:hypothetical protein
VHKGHTQPASGCLSQASFLMDFVVVGAVTFPMEAQMPWWVCAAALCSAGL